MGFFKSLDERIEDGCESVNLPVSKFYEAEQELIGIMKRNQYRGNQYGAYNIIAETIGATPKFVQWVSHTSDKFISDQHGGVGLK